MCSTSAWQYSKWPRAEINPLSSCATCYELLQRPSCKSANTDLEGQNIACSFVHPRSQIKVDWQQFPRAFSELSLLICTHWRCIRCKGCQRVPEGTCNAARGWQQRTLRLCHRWTRHMGSCRLCSTGRTTGPVGSPRCTDKLVLVLKLVPTNNSTY